MALTDNLVFTGVLFLSVVSCDISALGGAIDKLDKQMRFLIQNIEGERNILRSQLRRLALDKTVIPRLGRSVDIWPEV